LTIKATLMSNYEVWLDIPCSQVRGNYRQTMYLASLIGNEQNMNL
jgi:hypothetical protein